MALLASCRTMQQAWRSYERRQFLPLVCATCISVLPKWLVWNKCCNSLCNFQSLSFLFLSVFPFCFSSGTGRHRKTPENAGKRHGSRHTKTAGANYKIATKMHYTADDCRHCSLLSTVDRHGRNPMLPSTLKTDTQVIMSIRPVRRNDVFKA